MTNQLIDLSEVEFWLACVVAVLLLAQVTRAAARRWTWAAINIGFVALVLRWQALGVLGAVVIAYLLLQAMGRTRYRHLFLLLSALSGLGLFLINKLPSLSDEAGLHTLRSALSVIGFSYIALRMVEVIRAVFEGRHRPPDFPSTINYLLPFHMLAAGPIQSYDEFATQPPAPSAMTSRDVLEAGDRIAAGLFKKYVLAFALQKLFLTDFQAGGDYFFLEVQVFFLWLYLDFSAYADIAVGVGRLIGVATPENFNRPYLARNAIDFWERWHISLSMFIRRNIFIPIQLFLARRDEGRRPLLSASLAFTVSFVLCGLWHGLTLNFLLWGTAHAVALVIANLYRSALKGRLGRSGVKNYLADTRIRWAARFVTYEFVAFSLVTLFYPR